MMKLSTNWIIILSFILAFILAILPLPDWIRWFRPNWILLALLSWGLIFPDKVGVGVAWLSGFFLDIFENSILGEHALIFTIVVYLIVKFYARINFFTFLQKFAVIFCLVLLAQLLQFWFEISIGGRPISTFLYWLPVMTTALFWPWVIALFLNWQKCFNIE